MTKTLKVLVDLNKDQANELSKKGLTYFEGWIHNIMPCGNRSSCGLSVSDKEICPTYDECLSEKKVEVQSDIVTRSKSIPIYYRMVVKNGEWKVYDVVIEGISLIKNYRSQFREILQKKSPEDLLEILRKKVGNE